ncbi:MAG: 16S rRNA (cytosine(1402)-N(4))-methyltransferase RsmH [Candidatus Zixiibacteriota bacterium]
MGKSADEHFHEPVLLRQVVDWLALREGGVFVDFTAGAGGHLAAIAGASAADTALYGFDRDQSAIDIARSRLSSLTQLKGIFHAPFGSLSTVLRMNNVERIHAALFDLGLSSMQLDSEGRGFSFRHDGPLDMRMDSDLSSSATDLLNRLSVDGLSRILFEFGEERRAPRLARALVAARDSRPITTTAQLRGLTEKALGPANLNRTLARVFQALRIAVNDELTQLSDALPQALEALEPGGRIGIISYHSLEDRIAKRFFTARSGACVCPPRAPVCSCEAHAELRVLTRKPVTPDSEEIQRNPRARSAKLRVAEKLAAPTPTGRGA